MSARTLYLMRHGTPALTGRMLGRTDCGVTDEGVAACRAQAEGLAVVRVIASDLRRATRCAEAVAADLELTPHIDPRWRELDFGAWEGLESGAIDTAALGRFWADPDANPPPGGERWTALVERVGAAIGDLPAEPALVVTHGGAMRAALHVLCGFPLPQLWGFDLPYASVLALRIWDGPARSGQIVGLWP
ncbi:histidine phosphatase family protein [Sphingomonas sp.]|uniref:histidine phosphatase family protein n=1 Tax=Sphingomonas sp. TaxID=28214 RepID=UPI002ED9396B